MRYLMMLFLPVVFLLILGAFWQKFDTDAEMYEDGFFEYRLHRYEHDFLHRIPYWVMAVLLLIIINGIYVIKWMKMRISWSRTGVTVDPVPLRLIGLNLFLCPMLIVLHMVLRSMKI